MSCHHAGPSSLEPKVSLLVADDDAATLERLSAAFTESGFDVATASTPDETRERLLARSFAIVLSDTRLLPRDALSLLSPLPSPARRTVVILMTAFGSMESAVECLRNGAFDYLSKPFCLKEVVTVVNRARDYWLSSARPLPLPDAARPISRAKTLIGRSPKIVGVYKTMARASLSQSNVLIVGETGTGKELVARAIHENSSRHERKFVAVNCGALAENLLESELFGHVRGAFTGAIADKRGLFEEANGGTLLLDEIGDIGPSLQIKLLRVLQEGELRQVGGKEVRRTDVRVIAATHRSLETLVRAGRFREDLYYRLKVLTVSLPPLKERREDLPDLIHYFLGRYAEMNHKPVYHVSPDAMRCLERYAWPGNIRELEHAIERAVAMTRTDVIYPEDLPEEIVAATTGPGSEEPVTLRLASTSLDSLEKAHIERMLEEANVNKTRASALLGIDRATLYRKAHRYGIALERKRVV